MRAIDCGIDIGSTNVKVVLIDETGRALYTRSIPSPRVSDGIGPATDAMDLVSRLEMLIIEGWSQVGGGSPLRSITTAGVGEDGVGLRRDLKPTGLALPWFDKRATAEASLLRQAHGALSQRAGIAIDVDRTAAKWLWLHRHRPQEPAKADCWVALTDFPAVWWSGRTFMSCSLAPRTACFDVFERRWIDALLTATHAPRLPEILKAGQITGGVRKGLLRDSGATSSETIVVAGGHDHPIAASLIRRYDPKARVDSLGTANLVYGETAALAQPHLDSELAFSVPPHGSSAMSCLGVMELSAALAEVQTDNAFFASYLGNDRLPGSPPRNLHELNSASSDHGPGIRHALERASLNARRMLEVMREAGVPDGPIYTTGGWSRSRGFVELRASIFGEPVFAIGEMELTAIGAALFGSEAATGNAVSPLREADIQRVEPVAAWSTAYVQLQSSRPEP